MPPDPQRPDRMGVQGVRQHPRRRMEFARKRAAPRAVNIGSERRFRGAGGVCAGTSLETRRFACDRAPTDAQRAFTTPIVNFVKSVHFVLRFSVRYVQYVSGAGERLDREGRVSEMRISERISAMEKHRSIQKKTRPPEAVLGDLDRSHGIEASPAETARISRRDGMRTGHAREDGAARAPLPPA